VNSNSRHIRSIDVRLADKVEQAASSDGRRNSGAHARTILVGIILLSLFLRILWIKTPVARDEGVSGYVAMVWSQGLSPYSFPMASVNPPIAYLIYLISIQLFGNTIMPERIINNALFVVSIVVLYFIARDWYGKRVGLASAFFYGIFMNAPIFETHLAIPSSFSIPFIVFSIYSFSHYAKKERKSALLISGSLMSIASLVLQYQAVGIALLLLMLVYLKYTAFKQHNHTRSFLARNLTSSVCILATGVALPILVTVTYLWSYGIFASFLQSTILRFFGSGYVGQGDVPFSVLFLIIAEAVPLWVFSVVGFVWCVLGRRRYDVLLIAWTVVFLVIAVPPAHFGRHFSQLVPPASLLSGFAIASISKEIEWKRLLKRVSNKNVTGIFLITTLTLSFVPVIYFQPMQYPNTNFRLFKEDMYYSFGRNWDEQQEMVEYINLHAENAKIFIHGWEAELYWLSGHLAPGTRWTSSYRSAIPDITDQDYEQILNSVKAGDFDNVVLMSEFSPDEIMRLVPERYFFVKNVGLYSIYSKYNAEGYSIGYSFVENLNQADRRYSLENGELGDIRDLNETIYLPLVEELTINGESRVAVRQHPIAPWDSHTVDSSIIFNNISISPGSKLSFGVAMDPTVWNKDTDGVEFRVLVKDERGTHEMFSKYISPHENIEDRRWQDFLLDLSEFNGKDVSIYFVTNPGPNRKNAYDWAYWSKPLLLKSHT
jgi:hypothetical protein